MHIHNIVIVRRRVPWKRFPLVSGDGFVFSKFREVTRTARVQVIFVDC